LRHSASKTRVNALMAPCGLRTAAAAGAAKSCAPRKFAAIKARKPLD
jgi:hypothetical protein